MKRLLSLLLTLIPILSLSAQSAGTYQLVTHGNPENLDGGEYILVYVDNTNAHVMGSSSAAKPTTTNGYRNQVSLSKPTDDKIVITQSNITTDKVTPFKIVKHSDNEHYQMDLQNGFYLAITGTGTTNTKEMASTEADTKFEISVSDATTHTWAIESATQEKSGTKMRLQYNTGTPRFSSYAKTVQDCQLYKKVEEQTVEDLYIRTGEDSFQTSEKLTYDQNSSKWTKDISLESGSYIAYKLSTAAGVDWSQTEFNAGIIGADNDWSGYLDVTFNHDYALTVGYTNENRLPTGTYTLEVTKVEGVYHMKVVKPFTVYFDNTDKGWSSVNAYIWKGTGASVTNNAASPGEAMTNTSGNIWAYTFYPEWTQKPEYVRFSNASNQDDKTADLNFKDGHTYPDIYTVIYDNTDKGWSEIYAHFWKGSNNSGDLTMTQIPGTNLWTVNFCQYQPDQWAPTNVMFKKDTYNKSIDYTFTNNGLYPLAVHTAYFNNTNAQWTTPHAYVWNGDDNNTFPGVAMTNTEGNTWKFEYRSDWTPANIIFDDGVENSGNQTEDLTFTEGATYTCNKYTVTFVNSGTGWNAVKAYVWKGEGGNGNQNAAFPGVAMTNTSGDIWTYTFYPSWTPDNIIFSNADNDSQKTAGLTFVNKAECTYDTDGEKISGKVFTLATQDSDIEAGREIIIVAANSAFAMSTTQNSNNRGQAAITKNADNTIIVADDNTAVQIFTLEASRDNYKIKAGPENYIFGGSDSNYLHTTGIGNKTAKDNQDVAAISIINDNSAYSASVVFQGTNTKRTLRYNSGSSIFSCYESSSSVQPIAIYVNKSGSVTPTPTLNAPTITLSEGATDGVYPHGTTVTVSIATGNAGIDTTIQYKDGNGDWTTYTEPFEITLPAIHTIKARERSASAISAEASAQFTINSHFGEGNYELVTDGTVIPGAKYILVQTASGTDYAMAGDHNTDDATQHPYEIPTEKIDGNIITLDGTEKVNEIEFIKDGDYYNVSVTNCGYYFAFTGTGGKNLKEVETVVPDSHSTNSTCPHFTLTTADNNVIKIVNAKYTTRAIGLYNNAFGNYALSNVNTRLYVLQGSFERAEAPTISITGTAETEDGVDYYPYGSEITISTTESDATIYYTLDGSEPTTASAIYTAPVALTASPVTVKAKVAVSGKATSLSASQTYNLIAPAATFTPSAAVGPNSMYNYRTHVTIGLPGDLIDDATLYYTENPDGLVETAPTTESAVYTEPIELTRDEKIKVLITIPGYKSNTSTSALFNVRDTRASIEEIVGEDTSLSGPYTIGTYFEIEFDRATRNGNGSTTPYYASVPTNSTFTVRVKDEYKAQYTITGIKFTCRSGHNFDISQTGVTMGTITEDENDDMWEGTANEVIFTNYAEGTTFHITAIKIYYDNNSLPKVANPTFSVNGNTLNDGDTILSTDKITISSATEGVTTIGIQANNRKSRIYTAPLDLSGVVTSDVEQVTIKARADKEYMASSDVSEITLNVIRVQNITINAHIADGSQDGVNAVSPAVNKIREAWPVTLVSTVDNSAITVKYRVRSLVEDNDEWNNWEVWDDSSTEIDWDYYWLGNSDSVTEIFEVEVKAVIGSVETASKTYTFDVRKFNYFDLLNEEEFGLTGTYAEKTCWVNSNAEYLGDLRYFSSSVNIKNGEGIITTASGGFMHTILLEWNDEASGSNSYKLDIYAKNSPFTSYLATDIAAESTYVGSLYYNSTVNGVEHATTDTFEFDKIATNIAIVNASSRTAFINNILLGWGEEPPTGAEVTAPSVDVVSSIEQVSDGFMIIDPTTTVTLTTPTQDTTLHYTLDGSDPQTSSTAVSGTAGSSTATVDFGDLRGEVTVTVVAELDGLFSQPTIARYNVWANGIAEKAATALIDFENNTSINGTFLLDNYITVKFDKTAGANSALNNDGTIRIGKDCYVEISSIDPTSIKITKVELQCADNTSLAGNHITATNGDANYDSGFDYAYNSWIAPTGGAMAVRGAESIRRVAAARGVETVRFTNPTTGTYPLSGLKVFYTLPDEECTIAAPTLPASIYKETVYVTDGEGNIVIENGEPKVAESAVYDNVNTPIAIEHDLYPTLPIYYTIDGTDPSAATIAADGTSSRLGVKLYTAPIEVDRLTLDIRARVYHPETKQWGEMAEQTYIYYTIGGAVTGVFELVTNLTTLANNDKILILSQTTAGTWAALSSREVNNGRDAKILTNISNVSGEKGDGTSFFNATDHKFYNPSGEVQLIDLVEAEGGKWRFSVGTDDDLNPIYLTATSAGIGHTVDANDASLLTIAMMDDDEHVSIDFLNFDQIHNEGKDDEYGRLLYYYVLKRFGRYRPSQASAAKPMMYNVYIYRLRVDAPEVKIDDIEVANGASLPSPVGAGAEIKLETPDTPSATLYYQFSADNGANWSWPAKTYKKGELAVFESGTIKAWAEISGVRGPEVTASYTIKPYVGDTFSLVTDPSQLNDGDDIVIVGLNSLNQDGTPNHQSDAPVRTDAMGLYNSSSKQYNTIPVRLTGHEDIVSDPEHVTLTIENEDIQVLRLESIGEGTWRLGMGDGSYLSASDDPNTNHNYITTKTPDDENAFLDVNITIPKVAKSDPIVTTDESYRMDYEAKIKFIAPELEVTTGATFYGNNVVKRSNSGRISCFSDFNTDGTNNGLSSYVWIFRRGVNIQRPTFKVDGVAVDNNVTVEGTTVTIVRPEIPAGDSYDDYGVYYTLNGEDPDILDNDTKLLTYAAGATEADIPNTNGELNDDCVIKAMFVKLNGMEESRITTLNFTPVWPYQKATIVFSEQGLSNNTTVVGTTFRPDKYLTVEFAKTKSSSNPPKYFDKGTAVRLYSGSWMTIAPINDCTQLSIERIVFDCGAGDNAIDESLTVSDGYIIGEAKKWKTTAVGAIDNLKLTNKNGTGDVRYIKGMTIYYILKEARVAAPTTEPADGEYLATGGTASIFSDTPGAAISYRLNQADEMSSYTEPIVLTVDEGEHITQRTIYSQAYVEGFGWKATYDDAAGKWLNGSAYADYDTSEEVASVINVIDTDYLQPEIEIYDEDGNPIVEGSVVINGQPIYVYCGGVYYESKTNDGFTVKVNNSKQSLSDFESTNPFERSFQIKGTKSNGNWNSDYTIEVTATNAAGTETRDLTVNVIMTLPGEPVFTPGADDNGHIALPAGVPLSVYVEGADKVKYSIDYDATETNLTDVTDAEIDLDDFSGIIPVDVAGRPITVTVQGINTGYAGDLYVDDYSVEGPVKTCTVTIMPTEAGYYYIVFGQQSWNIYTSADRTKDWVATDGVTTFPSEATISSGSNYPRIVGGSLSLYSASNNTIVVNAPAGYFFEEVTGYVSNPAEVSQVKFGHLKQSGNNADPYVMVYNAVAMAEDNTVTEDYRSVLHAEQFAIQPVNGTPRFPMMRVKIVSDANRLPLTPTLVYDDAIHNRHEVYHSGDNLGVDIEQEQVDLLDGSKVDIFYKAILYARGESHPRPAHTPGTIANYSSQTYQDELGWMMGDQFDLPRSHDFVDVYAVAVRTLDGVSKVSDMAAITFEQYMNTMDSGHRSYKPVTKINQLRSEGEDINEGYDTSAGEEYNFGVSMLICALHSYDDHGLTVLSTDANETGVGIKAYKAALNTLGEINLADFSGQGHKHQETFVKQYQSGGKEYFYFYYQVGNSKTKKYLYEDKNNRLKFGELSEADFERALVEIVPVGTPERTSGLVSHPIKDADIVNGGLGQPFSIKFKNSGRNLYMYENMSSSSDTPSSMPARIASQRANGGEPYDDKPLFNSYVDHTQSNFHNILLYSTNDQWTTGVEDVLVDEFVGDEDAEVEYYTIQGYRVDADNLKPGFYIRRQGRVATKILVH